MPDRDLAMDCYGKADAVSCRDDYYTRYDEIGCVDKLALARLLEDSLSLGRLSCRRSENHESVSELHISGVGKIALPMAQDVQKQLQQMCQSVTYSQQPAEWRPRQAWQLTASLLALTSSGWNDAVCGLVQDLSKQLGVAHTASVEASLQKVSLVQEHVSFHFTHGADAPLGTFATMEVMLLAPGTSVHITVYPADQDLAVTSVQAANMSFSASEGLACFACFTGCKYELQVTGGSCYTSMTYHLVHPPCSAPIIIKDEAWYMQHLKDIMDAQFNEEDATYRNFYLFDHKSNDEDLHVTGLRQEHQQMAKLLHKAEQQGILDVLLVRVTLLQECSVGKSWPGQPINRQENSEAKVSDWELDDWRRLDGSQPGWVEGDLHRVMDAGQDFILQGEKWFDGLQPDREEDDVTMVSKDYIRYQRWKYAAGFVMWPCQNRWAVFCRQGVPAAYTKLEELIARHTALTTSLPEAVHVIPDETLPLSASEPSQAQQELAACRKDTVGLIQAMHRELYWNGGLEEQTVPGFESFGHVALAFELPGIYQDLLEKRLQIQRLDQGTALELVKASRALSWSSLYPILNAMAELTCFGPRDDHELSVLHMLNAFEALDLLLGVEEAGMPAVVADIAVTMTKFTQDCIADGRLPGCGSHCYAAWWLHNLPDHLPMFGTRPWSTVQAPCLHEDEHMRGPMPPPRGSVSTTAAHERDSYADRCNLVVVAFKLFQSLTLRARQAQGSTQELEEAICGLVDACLACPMYFYAPYILGHACVKIAEARDTPLPFTEPPAAIKLVVGCVQQLRQAALLQQPPCAQDRCVCTLCKGFQAFLKDPMATQSHGVATSKDAWHVVRHMQAYADAEGHILLQPARRQHQSKCKRESETDGLERVQQALSLLATVQQIFNQMVVDLFVQSGKAPPEDHDVPKAEPEPPVVLYNPWQAVKLKPLQPTA